MSTRLVEQAARIETLASTEAVWDHALLALAQEGIEIVIYLSSGRDLSGVRVLSNRPAIHSEGNASRDPFLTWLCDDYAIRRTGIEYLSDHGYLPEDARAFVRNAAEHGFRSGIALPMRLAGSRRFGGFNLGTGLDREAFEARIAPHAETFRFFCLTVHRHLEELGFESPAGTVPESGFRDRLMAPPAEALDALSPREREVIYLQALGLRRKEVARMCGISPYTVAEYTSKAYRKLGIHNRSQAARLVFDS